MPPKRRRTSPPSAGIDRLGALPDDALHLVLSHLPAEDAVRTCVLARRWLNLWKSATGLHIRRSMQNPESAKAAREFVDHLLLLRGGAPLDTVELRINDVDEKVENDMARIRLWIRHIMTCRVQVLTLEIHISSHWPSDDDTARLRGQTLISNHLRELHLFGIDCENELLDFSCCPALEVLEIGSCQLGRADTISSPSLRCLRIHDTIFHSDARVQIHAPNIRSLRLELENNRAPLLARMPFLVEAFVEICGSTDYCYNSAFSGDCEDECCEGCHAVDGDTDNCVLLQGLSEARNLALISYYINVFTFRRDLKWCPVFGNLKTLLLNDYWCEPADFSALAYMLEHSPVLEKLTLVLDCKWCQISEAQVLKGIPDPTERSDTMPKHLKMVELKCKVVDGDAVDVLKFFGKLGICFRF